MLRSEMPLWLSQVAFSPLFSYRRTMLASLRSLGTSPLSQKSWNRLKSCSVSASPPTLKISGGVPSGPGGLLVFSCVRAEGVNQGTLRRILNCLVFDAGGLVQQLAEVCCPGLQDVGFLRQKSAV